MEGKIEFVEVQQLPLWANMALVGLALIAVGVAIWLMFRLCEGRDK